MWYLGLNNIHLWRFLNFDVKNRFSNLYNKGV